MHSNYKYAKTLFDISIKSNSVDVIQNQLKSLAYLYNKVPTFRLVFITKRINDNDKIKIIKNALNRFEPMIVELISILISNNQTNNLLNIITRFNKMVKAESTINKIEITTSEKLNNAELELISKTIFDKLASNPKINLITDPKIVGGIKLRIGNKIFDNSVSYQMNQLKKVLHNM